MARPAAISPITARPSPAAGWTVADITSAIIEVAENLRLQAEAIDDTERQIAEAVRKASS